MCVSCLTDLFGWMSLQRAGGWMDGRVDGGQRGGWTAGEKARGWMEASHPRALNVPQPYHDTNTSSAYSSYIFNHMEPIEMIQIYHVSMIGHAWTLAALVETLFFFCHCFPADNRRSDDDHRIPVRGEGKTECRWEERRDAQDEAGGWSGR